MRWLALVAAAAWALSAGGAAACRFAFPKSAAEHLAGVDVLFVGQAEWTRPVGKAEQETRFRVTRTIKGRVQPVLIVRQTTDTTCGFISYRPGESVVVLARKLDGHLITSVTMAPHFSLEAYQKAARQDSRP